MVTDSLDSNEHRPPALLVDAMWYGTLAAARDLGAHGVEVTLASDSWVAPARWSRHVTRTVSCPSSKDAAAFVAWLLRFGAAHPGHFLYPTSDDVAWLIAAHSEALSRSFRLYTPPIESLVRLLDKGRLIEDARAVGLDVPPTSLPRNETEVEQSGRELAFPLYVKPRAQVLGRGLGKGVRVEKLAALLPSWQVQRNAANYDAEVIDRVPDLRLPLIQSCASNMERIYSVDGFIDETGEIYASLASLELLHRPRASSAAIIIEHAETDPVIEQRLRRLFQTTGFCGVFDAEFIECGAHKQLIDINPRFYGHMAFEMDRGLHLPWLAYVAATRDREALKAEVEKAKAAHVARRAYVHRLPTALLLAGQRLSGAMSGEDRFRWRRWISEYRGSITDPAHAVDDPAPRIAEVAMEAVAFMRHPRAYLRALWWSPD
jgi:D-aspartate ligase